MTHDELKGLLIEWYHAIKDVSSEDCESRFLEVHHRLLAAAKLAEEAERKSRGEE